MKFFVNSTVDILLLLLSFIIPKKNNTYLFGAGDGSSFKGNPKYLYLHMLQNRKDLSPLWITGNISVYKELRSRNLPVVLKNTLKGFGAILRSRYLVIEIMTKDIIYAGFTALGRFTFIQTFHGMPLKKIANDANQGMKGIGRLKIRCNEKIVERLSMLKASLKKNLLYKQYKVITASCDTCADIYKGAFCNNNVAVLGFTRNDIFFNNDLKENNFKKNLDINNYKKIISYVPTFRDIDTGKKPFTETGLKKLNAYLAKNNIIFLVKKHPYDNTLSVSGEYSNIRDISRKTGDIMQLLAVTDILITDYSSVFFDFILSGKPVIYYSYDYNEYMAVCRDMYYDYYSTLPGPFAVTEGELQTLLETCGKWFNKKDYLKKYFSFTERFNRFHDGNSCQRLLEYIAKHNI